MSKSTITQETILTKRVRELSYFVSRQDWTFEDTLGVIGAWVKQRRTGPTADRMAKLLQEMKTP